MTETFGAPLKRDWAETRWVMQSTEGGNSSNRIFSGHGSPGRDRSGRARIGVIRPERTTDRDSEALPICNFATPDHLIEGDGVLSPVSCGAQSCFPGILGSVALGDSREAATEVCWPDANLRGKTTG